MNQVWLVLTREEERHVVLNIMTTGQKRDLLAGPQGRNVIVCYQIGCTDLRIHNLDVMGSDHKCANWFSRIYFGQDKAYQLSRDGSLIYLDENKKEDNETTV